MIRLFVLKIDDNNEDILLSKMSLLSCEEKDKAVRFKYPRDKALSLGGRLLLFCFGNRFMNENYVNLNHIDDLDEFNKENMADFEIKYDELGKGYVNQYGYANHNDNADSEVLKEAEDNFYYNISHSGDYVVCAFSDKPVGVDIQKIKSLKENFAKRYFNERDNIYIESVSESEKTDRMIKVWTAKESYSKLTGKGISGGFNGFYEDFEKMRTIDAETDREIAEITEFAVDPAYYCFASSPVWYDG